tara:strand:- start:1089 stop:1409 length:321 start_codon:yes stop_codon:yes gene_type:complete
MAPVTITFQNIIQQYGEPDNFYLQHFNFDNNHNSWNDVIHFCQYLASEFERIEPNIDFRMSSTYAIVREYIDDNLSEEDKVYASNRDGRWNDNISFRDLLEELANN